MRSRRLTIEPLENRTLLAADVATESLPQEPLPGDANEDGAFDPSDLIQVLQAGKYFTGEQAEWSEGDWNRDGNFNESDLVFAFQTGKYAHGVAAQGQGQAVKRPFHATSDMQWASFVPDTIGRCPADSVYFISTYVGTVQATHLGRADVTAVHCTDMVNPGFPFKSGELTLIAANGDELYGTYSGAATFVEPTAIGWSADIRFDDGTGRFAGATGEAKEFGVVDRPTSTATSTIDGMITYNASNRRA